MICMFIQQLVYEHNRKTDTVKKNATVLNCHHSDTEWANQRSFKTVSA